MKKDESPDSLDFTEARPGKPATPAAARRKPAPRAEPPKPPKPAGSQKLFVLILAVLAIAAVIAFAMKEDVPPQPAPSSASPQSAPPARAPGAPAQSSPQPYPPPVPTAAPRSATSPELKSVSAMPPDFLKAVRVYNTKPAYKAMALALDSDGKWAYGTVSGWAEQPGANAEALSECERHKPKSGAQSGCRLFATGDSVVW